MSMIKYGSIKCMNVIPFRVIPLLYRVEVIMINFNNKKTKSWFTAILILILIVAMVVPMVAYLIP